MHLRSWSISIVLTMLYSVQFLHAAVPHNQHVELSCHEGALTEIAGCDESCEESLFDWLSCLFGDVEHSDSNLELDVKEYSSYRALELPATLPAFRLAFTLVEETFITQDEVSLVSEEGFQSVSKRGPPRV